MAIQYEDDDAVDVQMTPLIDCVFLLLIFFLVSSQMKKIERELPIQLPTANVTRQVKATPQLITVSVDKFGEIYVNSQAVGAEGLRARLREAGQNNPDQRIRISGDIYAPFRSVVHVLDTCQSEGLRVIGINTAVQ